MCLTFDLDWAPDEAVDELVGLLTSAGVRATLFTTHATRSLDRLPEAFEIALHPNFNDCDGAYEARLHAVKEAYPAALGARSHSLFVASPILDVYARAGLIYESNIFLPAHPGLRPVLRFENMVSVPFWWADDVHFTRGSDFRLSSLPLADPGMKVFTFHPIHVFMNTASPEHYMRFKPHYHDPSALRMLRNDGHGTATLLEELVAHIVDTSTRTWTVGEIATTFLEACST